MNQVQQAYQQIWEKEEVSPEELSYDEWAEVVMNHLNLSDQETEELWAHLDMLGYKVPYRDIDEDEWTPQRLSEEWDDFSIDEIVDIVSNLQNDYDAKEIMKSLTDEQQEALNDELMDRLRVLM
ncbi:MAG: hypothetical protein MJZ92_05720 [Paludibacteraceae bacterium]|nr:hypothetical protein [Paludibacteraceae bacterium]